MAFSLISSFPAGVVKLTPITDSDLARAFFCYLVSSSDPAWFFRMGFEVDRVTFDFSGSVRSLSGLLSLRLLRRTLVKISSLRCVLERLWLIRLLVVDGVSRGLLGFRFCEQGLKLMFLAYLNFAFIVLIW